jgi:hypothetical protein
MDSNFWFREGEPAASLLSLCWRTDASAMLSWARPARRPYAAQMDRERELKIVRRAYAKQVTAAADVGDPRVAAAFAAVAREDFLGPGPGRSCAGAVVIVRRRMPTRFTCTPTT